MENKNDLLIYFSHSDFNQIINEYYYQLKNYYNTPVQLEILELIKDKKLDSGSLELLLKKWEVNNDEIDHLVGIINKIPTLTSAALEQIDEQLKNIVSVQLFDQAKQEGEAPYSLLSRLNSLKLKFNKKDLYSDIIRSCTFDRLDAKLAKESLGSPIKSSIQSINDLSVIGGYIKNQLVCVCGGAGCFVGETKVLTLDHSVKTMKELNESNAKDIEVYSCDDYGNIKISKADRCVITKYVSELVEVYIDGIPQRCTLDHPFMLIDGSWVKAKDLMINDGLMPIHRVKQPHKLSMIRSSSGHSKDLMYERTKNNFSSTIEKTIKRNTGDKSDQKKCGVKKFLNGLISSGVLNSPEQITEEFYTSNRYKFIYSNFRTPSYNSAIYYYDGNLELMYNDALNWDNHTVTDIKIIKLDEPVPVYDLLNVDKYHNFAIATDDTNQTGVFVHNSGKSLFLTAESISFCKQNYQVHYFALGDLNQLDFITRIPAIGLKLTLNESLMDLENSYKKFVELNPYIKNLHIYFVDPGKLNINDLTKFCELNGFLSPGHIIIIDYDSNLSSDFEMYQKGGEIYDGAAALKSEGKADLVMIASQPKDTYIGVPVIPMNGLAESSRKYQILDMMIMIGMEPDSVNPVGYINIPKFRRGGRPDMFPYVRDSTGTFYKIDQSTYHIFKHKKGFVKFKTTEDYNKLDNEDIENLQSALLKD